MAAAVMTSEVRNDEERKERSHIFLDTSSFEEISVPLRGSSRLRYTCLCVSKKYIGLGCNTGGGHIFNKDSLKHVQVVFGGDSSSTCVVSISPSEMLVAFASSNGLVTIMGMNIGKRVKPEKLKTSSEHTGNIVTSLKWDPTSTRLFVGDDAGKVSMSIIPSIKAKNLFFQQNEIILRETAIVQIDWMEDRLLASTVNACFICNSLKQQYTQIGKKPRDGQYGACYLRKPEMAFPIIYSARPGSRVWEVDFNGNVLSTHQFKKILNVPSMPIIYSEKNDVLSTSKKAESQSVVFKKLYQFCDNFLLCSSSNAVYVIDPFNDSLILWADIGDHLDIACIGNELYILHRDMQVTRKYLLPLKKVFSWLITKEKWLHAGILATQFHTTFTSLVQQRKISRKVLVHLQGQLMEQQEPNINSAVEKLLEKIQLDAGSDSDTDSISSFDSNHTLSGEKYMQMDSGIFRIRNNAPNLKGFDDLSVESYDSFSSYTYMPSDDMSAVHSSLGANHNSQEVAFADNVNSPDSALPDEILCEKQDREDMVMSSKKFNTEDSLSIDSDSPLEKSTSSAEWHETLEPHTDYQNQLPVIVADKSNNRKAKKKRVSVACVYDKNLESSTAYTNTARRSQSMIELESLQSETGHTGSIPAESVVDVQTVNDSELTPIDTSELTSSIDSTDSYAEENKKPSLSQATKSLIAMKDSLSTKITSRTKSLIKTIQETKILKKSAVAVDNLDTEEKDAVLADPDTPQECTTKLSEAKPIVCIDELLSATKQVKSDLQNPLVIINAGVLNDILEAWVLVLHRTMKEVLIKSTKQVESGQEEEKLGEEHGVNGSEEVLFHPINQTPEDVSTEEFGKDIAVLDEKDDKYHQRCNGITHDKDAILQKVLVSNNVDDSDCNSGERALSHISAEGDSIELDEKSTDIPETLSLLHDNSSQATSSFIDKTTTLFDNMEKESPELSSCEGNSSELNDQNENNHAECAKDKEWPVSNEDNISDYRIADTTELCKSCKYDSSIFTMPVKNNLIFTRDPISVPEVLLADIRDLCQLCFRYRCIGNVSIEFSDWLYNEQSSLKSFGSHVEDFSCDISKNTFPNKSGIPNKELLAKSVNCFRCRNFISSSPAINIYEVQSAGDLDTNDEPRNISSKTRTSRSSKVTAQEKNQIDKHPERSDCDFSWTVCRNCLGKLFSHDLDLALFIQLYFFLLKVEDVRSYIVISDQLTPRSWYSLISCLQDSVEEWMREETAADVDATHVQDFLNSISNKEQTLGILVSLFQYSPTKTIELCLELDCVHPVDILYMCLFHNQPAEKYILQYMLGILVAEGGNYRYEVLGKFEKNHTVLKVLLESLLLLNYASKSSKHQISPRPITARWKHENLVKFILQILVQYFEEWCLNLCTKYRYWRGCLRILKNSGRSEDHLKTIFQVGDISLLDDENELGYTPKSLKEWGSLLTLMEGVPVSDNQNRENDKQIQHATDCSLTWENIGKLMMRQLGPQATLCMLQSCRVGDGALSDVFYQGCIISAMAEKQQKFLIHEMLEKIDTYLWSQRQTVMAPQLFHAIGEEKRNVFEKTDLSPNIQNKFTALSALDTKRCAEDHECHWGVRTSILSDCSICGLLLTEMVSHVEPGVVILECGHGYHKSCIPERNCVVCDPL